MAKLFDELLESIKTANGDKEDEIYKAFEAKRDELQDATNEEVSKAFQELLMSHLSEVLEGASDDEDDDENEDLSDEDKEYMENANAVVKEFLDSNDWHYFTRNVRDDLVIYQMNMGIKGISLTLRIHVEADPDVCRIDAVLPVSANQIYAYPLCSILAKENYPKRFGSFKYDERDGEITYEYSFLARNGINKDDLETYFNAIIGSAISGYENIFKCCVGKFKKDEINDILNKVNKLVRDISE